jgi:hypothetical protein
MDYSKLLDWSPPLSGYAALSGGVNAWGLGGMGVVRRGGFGSGGSNGGSGVLSPYTGQIATRSSVPVATNGTNKQMMSRSRHLCQQAVTSLQILVPNFYVTTAGVETALGATSTVTASIEYPAGTFTQVLFSASSSGTVPDGGMLLSDAVAVTIPRGVYFFVRMYITNTAGIYFGNHGIIDFGNGEGFNYGVSGIVDQTLGGTVINKDSIDCVYPLAIIGITNRASVAIIGDSRGYGQNDTNSDSTGDRGEIARSVGPNYAYINLSVPGDKAQTWIANSTQRRLVAAYCNRYPVQLGINDLTASRTSAQLITDFATIFGLLGGKKYPVTIPPKSTSSDSWATTANQTVDAASNVNRISFNGSVRSGLSWGYSVFRGR